MKKWTSILIFTIILALISSPVNAVLVPIPLGDIFNELFHLSGQQAPWERVPFDLLYYADKAFGTDILGLKKLGSMGGIEYKYEPLIDFGFLDKSFLLDTSITGYASSDNVILPEPTDLCTDGVRDGDEEGIDCGGSCPPCVCIEQLLFEDDFNDNDASDWTVTEGSWSVINGEYTASDIAYSMAPYLPNGSYRITGRFNIGSMGTWKEADIIFKTKTQNGFRQGQYHQIQNRVDIGQVYPVRYDDIKGNLDWYTEIGTIYYPFEENTWYNFELILHGMQVDYYIEGNHMFSITLHDGEEQYWNKLGFKTYPNTASYFDDIKVYSYCGNDPQPTCSDGIQNGDEEGIDCGGSCPNQDCCTNGYQDDKLGEGGVDCGGNCLKQDCYTNGFPGIEWDKTFSSSLTYHDFSVKQTSDKGYIIVGNTESLGAGRPDVWLIKTDSSGNEQWNKTFGGTHSDTGHSVQQTSDGGYIVAGETGSFNDDDNLNAIWLIKTDSSGNEEWNKLFRGYVENSARSIQQTSDGGYVIVGSKRFFRSHSHYVALKDCGIPYWYEDVWLIKTDSSGNEQWNKTFGGSKDHNEGYSVQQTSDGGYIILGDISSCNTSTDVWLIKTDSSGNEQWNKTFDSYLVVSRVDSAVQQTSDGGYITISTKIDSSGASGSDVWLIKMDSSGNEQWNKTFSRSKHDKPHSVQQTYDGGYVIVGDTLPYNALYYPDAWLIKTDSSGNEQWNKTFGSSGYETGVSVQQTSDRGYVIVASRESFGDGQDDIWLIKIYPEYSDCVSTCNDDIQNGDEEGIDCGGSCANACACNEIVFSDDGEKGILENRWIVHVGNADYSEKKSYNGNRCISLDSRLPNDVSDHGYYSTSIIRELPLITDGSVTLFFYEYMDTNIRHVIIAAGKEGVSSVSFEADTNVNRDHYIVTRGSTTGGASRYATTFKRTEGWHKATMKILGNSRVFYIDDTEVYSISAIGPIDQMWAGVYGNDPNEGSIDDVIVRNYNSCENDNKKSDNNDIYRTKIEQEALKYLESACEKENYGQEDKIAVCQKQVQCMAKIIATAIPDDDLEGFVEEMKTSSYVKTMNNFNNKNPETETFIMKSYHEDCI